jgi:hypothetical protein
MSAGRVSAMMIGRVWHGWTTHANAEAFEAYIRNEEWPAIFARNIKGLREIEPALYKKLKKAEIRDMFFRVEKEDAGSHSRGVGEADSHEKA